MICKSKLVYIQMSDSSFHSTLNIWVSFFLFFLDNYAVIGKLEFSTKLIKDLGNNTMSTLMPKL